MKTCRRRDSRSGTILVLSAVLMILLLGMVAFALDLGYLCIVGTELKRSADAASLAAAWELLDENFAAPNSSCPVPEEYVRAIASEYATLNVVGGAGPALAVEDVVIGYLVNPSDPSAEMTFNDPSQYNAVRVRIRRTEEQNGAIPLFFARALGISRTAVQGEATAAFLNNFAGFQTPSSGENVNMLPFAMDRQSWDDLLVGVGSDNWTWDEGLQASQPGSDGALEVNLFPQETGSPGNRGTVDIGSDNNSTADVARQILHGITPQDLAYHGGSLQLDGFGQLILGADPGISAGVKDELASIIGRPTTILLFDSVSGSGNSAQYIVVGFAGVRIVEVDLTGSAEDKRVIVQPAAVLVSGGIPTTEPNTQTSYSIYSSVWLAR